MSWPSRADSPSAASRLATTGRPAAHASRIFTLVPLPTRRGATTISAAAGADAVQKMLSLGIVGNGSDGVYGSYDSARVQSMIAAYTPVFTARGKAPKPGLAPSDLFTNEFLNKNIKL